MRTKLENSLDNTFKILDLWLPRKVDYMEVPGLSIAIHYKGKVVYNKSYGYSDLESKKTMTPNSLYRIASISKTFTSVAILQLFEKGKINLDESVEKYVPWFKYKDSIGNTKNITIRQILCHMSGIFRDGTTPHWAINSFPKKEQFRKTNLKNSLTIENQTEFKYSNFAFSLLGEVIKNVSGFEYEEYVKINIIEKVCLKNTYADFNPKINGIASGYSCLIPGKKREKFSNSYTSSYSPATGFISNASDLVLFFSLISPANENKLLSKESKKIMISPSSREGGNNYGFGVQINKFGKRIIVGHSGFYPGYCSNGMVDIENDISISVLVNSNDYFPQNIVQGIFKTIYELIDEHETYFSDTIKIKKNYDGIYEAINSEICVTNIGSILVVSDFHSDFPLTNKTRLVNTLNENEFMIKSEDKIGSVGEKAKFVLDKKMKKYNLFWGTFPYKQK